MPDTATRSPLLRFDTGVLSKEDLKKARANLSAVVLRGEHLWLGGDEGTSIDRMTRDASGNFGKHERFDLHGLLGLPGQPDKEIDIEGLDVDGGYLWLIGSHSAKRKKVDDSKTPAENVARLSQIEGHGNRFTLARVPLDAQSRPVPKHGALTAARLRGDARGNLLTDALRQDVHVGRFVPRVLADKSVEGIPSKDNGLDVEGLAVSGDRVLLGLRGPVLRGWSVVVELRVADLAGGLLMLQNIGPAGAPYVKHLLQLGGLGVRDLVITGKDVLVLAGPTMDLDGPVFVFRWKDPFSAGADSLTRKEDLARMLAVPFGVTTDHAEGLTCVDGTPASVLVCYDSPGNDRLDQDDGVRADIFTITP